MFGEKKVKSQRSQDSRRSPESKSISDADSDAVSVFAGASQRRKSFMRGTIAAARKKGGAGARSPDAYSGIENWKNSLRQGETGSSRMRKETGNRKNKIRMTPGSVGIQIDEESFSVKNNQKNISCSIKTTIKREVRSQIRPEVRSSPALRKITNVTTIATRVKTAKNGRGGFSRYGSPPIEDELACQHDRCKHSLNASNPATPRRPSRTTFVM